MGYGGFVPLTRRLIRPRRDEEIGPRPSETPSLMPRTVDPDEGPPPPSLLPRVSDDALTIKRAAGERLAPRPPEARPELVPLDREYGGVMTPGIDLGRAELAPRSEALPEPDRSTTSYLEPRDSGSPRVELERRAPSYAAYNRERQSLPAEQEYLEAHKPRGFWGRVGQDLKLAGKTFVASGFNPIYAAGAAAIGAADPNAYNRMVYRTELEPHSLARQQQYLSQAGHEIGMQKSMADEERLNRQLDLNAEAKAQQLAFKYDQLQQLHDKLEMQERLGNASNEIKQMRAETAEQLADLKSQMAPVMSDYYARRGEAATAGAQTAQGRLAEERKRTRILQQRADALGPRGPKANRASIQAAITDEWIRAGRTPSGLVIQNGRVQDPDSLALSDVPLEQHPEYKREVTRRFAEAQTRLEPRRSGQGNRIPARGNKTVAASQLQQILQHPSVKGRGITDLNALRKDMAAHGYTILEDQ